MATRLVGGKAQDIQSYIRTMRTRKMQRDKARELQAAEKERQEKAAKGNLLGTGLGLLGAVGATMLTGGLGGMAALKAVAASPLLAGISSGAGSAIGEMVASKDEIENIENLSRQAGRMTGAGSIGFGKDIKEAYGDTEKDARSAALMGGLQRGMQIGSLAGGMQSIGNLGKMAQPGSMMSNLGQRLNPSAYPDSYLAQQIIPNFSNVAPKDPSSIMSLQRLGIGTSPMSIPAIDLSATYGI